jgi:hypothetical protein
VRGVDESQLRDVLQSHVAWWREVSTDMGGVSVQRGMSWESLEGPGRSLGVLDVGNAIC